jgi:hypothetical protein
VEALREDLAALRAEHAASERSLQAALAQLALSSEQVARSVSVKRLHPFSVKRQPVKRQQSPEKGAPEDGGVGRCDQPADWRAPAPRPQATEQMVAAQAAHAAAAEAEQRAAAASERAEAAEAALLRISAQSGRTPLLCGTAALRRCGPRGARRVGRSPAAAARTAGDACGLERPKILLN